MARRSSPLIERRSVPGVSPCPVGDGAGHDLRPSSPHATQTCLPGRTPCSGRWCPWPVPGDPSRMAGCCPWVPSSRTRDTGTGPAGLLVLGLRTSSGHTPFASVDLRHTSHQRRSTAGSLRHLPVRHGIARWRGSRTPRGRDEWRESIGQSGSEQLHGDGGHGGGESGDPDNNLIPPSR